MKFNKQELRKAAEKATEGNYVVGHCDINKHGNLSSVYVCQEWNGMAGGVVAECHVNCLTKNSDQVYANAGFMAFASPANVISLLEEISTLESRCAELAAENAGLKAICEDRRTFIMNGVQLGYIQVPTVETDPALETIRVAVSPQEQTPATDAFLAEVRASSIPDEATERDLFEEWVMEKIFISKTTLEGLRTDDGYRNSTLSGTDYNGMWSQWKAIRAAQLRQEAAQ
ncbi:ead/Ea22-like family protein [Enterobacter ludwigii]|uniref:ead/Ea22-like family protein n=1 Tax=Enterobacter ludwigii TaxID=299767 RepID=UPI001BA6D43D|nr:ead/Ea22-like family protein [Enterobacter ludwigii]MBS0870761.1 ead/Ea22-like family protein [Enterobacter ludwigii]